MPEAINTLPATHNNAMNVLHQTGDALMPRMIINRAQNARAMPEISGGMLKAKWSARETAFACTLLKSTRRRRAERGLGNHAHPAHLSPRHITRRAAAELACRVTFFIKAGQANTGEARRHANDGRDPHPEYRAGIACGDSQSHAGSDTLPTAPRGWHTAPE